MGTQTILTLISITLMLILGLPNLIEFFKIKKTKIIYLEKNLLNLKQDLLSNFEKLNITYKGVQVNSKIYFVKSFFVCYGYKDIISPNNIIEIITPEDSTWLNFKVVNSTKGVTANSSFKNNCAKLEFDLLKSKEVIEFEGIIETNKKLKANDKLISLYHRIPNINKIENFKIEELKNSAKILYQGLILLALGLFMFFYSLEMNILKLTAHYVNNNKEVENNSMIIGSPSYTEIKSNLTDNEWKHNIFIRGKSNNYKIIYDDIEQNRIIKKSEFIYFKIKKDADYWVYLIISLIIIIFSILVFYVGGYTYLTKSKFLKLVES